jgi:predicted enzyme related to lactoylglutathione lyase
MDLHDASVCQILIPVDDLDRAIGFYRDTLGFSLLFTAPPQMSFFQCGSIRLLVGVPPEDHPRQRVPAIYFEVQDIEAVCKELERRGVALGGQPHIVHRTETTEVWLAEFLDPDGNQLALMSERDASEGVA